VWNNTSSVTHLQGPNVLRGAVATNMIGATLVELDKEHACAHCLLYPNTLSDDGVDAWTAAVHVFMFSDLLFFDFLSCLWFCTTGLSKF